jgi:ABC-2 type transport system ATP-binding protein
MIPLKEPNQGFIIEVDDLTKRFGKLVAVDHVSFQVKQGELFGFLGPNGAGKTTTIRILTGVIKADGGNVFVSGYRAGSLKAKQIAGVVPEMSNAYPDLSGWDNLMLMCQLYGITIGKAKERSKSLLEEMGLFARKNDLTKAYSKGMKQRLILCMALVSDPAVLFLDEPTSGLDVQSARLIKDMLQRLGDVGKTIFLTTHDMEEANQFCNRVAIINKGKIVAIDAPEKLRLATSSMHSVEVSFASAVNQETLAQLPGITTMRKLGDKYRLYTDNPGDLVVSLVKHSDAVGSKIISLNILAPSLEDAFVALTEKETSHV